MIRKYRIPTRRFIVRRIARSVWDLANAYPHAPAVSFIAAIALLYFINR